MYLTSSLTDAEFFFSLFFNFISYTNKICFALCACVPASVYLYHAWVPAEAQVGIKFPGTKAAGSCNESGVGAETTCGPLKEH